MQERTGDPALAQAEMLSLNLAFCFQAINCIKTPILVNMIFSQSTDLNVNYIPLQHHKHLE